jgi:hypothetical protein
MIREWLTQLITPFPAPARRMRYLYEQIAIRARHRRHRAAWAPHLVACRDAVRQAVPCCQGQELAAIVGAGVCLDMPLPELTARFRRVVLLDVGFLDRPASCERCPYDQGPGSPDRLPLIAPGANRRISLRVLSV